MSNSEQADTSIFDNTFKTMLRRDPEITVNFVNEVFGQDYAADEAVELLNSEHENRWGHTFDDSTFKIRGNTYHLECQSTNDNSLVIRMLEYDISIALERAIGFGAPYVLDLPRSCIVHLRPTKSTPDKVDVIIRTYDEQRIDYRSSVVKSLDYSIENIFERRLFLLLPFYLMRCNAHYIEKTAHDADMFRDLVAECTEIGKRLERELLTRGKETLYRDLVEYLVTISDYLLAKHDDLRLKVRNAMGGSYIEMMDEKVERLTKERDEAERGRDEAERVRDEAERVRDEAERGRDEVQAKYDALVLSVRQILGRNLHEDIAQLLSQLPEPSDTNGN